MLMIIALALPLVVAAVICLIVAGRIDLKRKIKSWSGERSTVAEAESARKQILRLRAAAGLCFVAAVVGAIALNLLSAYTAYGAH
jgi:hypothetical protein